MQEVLQLFSDRGTVDDLGIGTVRDVISNALFPGTSVIQTRARYFLFVPWIFGRSQDKHRTMVVAKSADIERKLVTALRAGGDLEGLIGQQAGENVRILPSAIYWSGLATYGIFQRPGLSIAQYGRAVARGVVTTDVEDELAEVSASFWHGAMPRAPKGFFDLTVASFALTYAEADWLCERILSTESSGRTRSLLAAYVHEIQSGAEAPNGDTMWDSAIPGSAPPAIADLVFHAQRFSCAVYGAALLYNLMLAERRDPTVESTPDTSVDSYQDRLLGWLEWAETSGLSNWAAHPAAFWASLDATGTPVPLRTRGFVTAVMDQLSAGPQGFDNDATRRLITTREIEHKRGQARLANPKRLRDWEGNAGTTPLGFRWFQVRRILRDLADGLQSGDANAVD